MRETDERKSNVLSCFYTCFLILSYLFSFVDLAPTLHVGVWYFNLRSSLRKAWPRGTLIAVAIIKATGKLRINLSLDSPQLSVSPTSKSFALQNMPALQAAGHEVFTKPVNPTTEIATFWNRYLLQDTFTSAIYKCSYLFSDSKTMATLVNYTCKSFIKLAPDTFKAPSTRIQVNKSVRIRQVDRAKAWLWLNWFGRILAVLVYRSEKKIETGLIERRFYMYFCFQEWSICDIYNKTLFHTSLRSRRLEVVGTRKNGRVAPTTFKRTFQAS